MGHEKFESSSRWIFTHFLREEEQIGIAGKDTHHQQMLESNRMAVSTERERERERGRYTHTHIHTHTHTKPSLSYVGDNVV